MKNTILSNKDVLLLEKLITGFGRIVTFKQLSRVFKEKYDIQETRNRVSLLAKNGWLVRIKRGLYIVVTDLGSMGTGGISLHTVAQVLNKNSYISFENALQFHGLFDQMLSSMAAVTFDRARTYKLQTGKIKFYHIKKALYFGFDQKKSDLGLVNIAKKEKALLDILYYRPDRFHASLVWEKLSSNKKIIDFNILKHYTLKFNLNVIRHIGFFLEHLGIDANDLNRIVKGKNSYSRMSTEAKVFDAKWRLYYERSIIE